MARKMKTMDGNSAVAHVSYAFTDVAAIYPITPSSVMADLTDKFSAMGTKNLFGREVQVTENAVGRRCFRCGSRFACSRCFNHNLHSFTGLASYDSEYVQDGRRAFTGRNSCICPCSYKPRSFNFR